MTKTELQNNLFSRLCVYLNQFNMQFKYDNSSDYDLKGYMLYDKDEYTGYQYPNLKTLLLSSKYRWSIFDYNYKLMDPDKKYFNIFEPLTFLKSDCLEELAIKMDLMGI